MAALAGWRADVYVASDSDPFTLTEFVAGEDDRTFTHPISQRLDPATPIEVRRGGVVVGRGEYRVRHPGAAIVFHEPQAAETITVSGATLDFMSRVARGRNWEYNLSVDMQEADVFGEGWHEYEATLRGGTVSIGRFFVDPFFVSELGKPLYLLLYPEYTGASSSRFECVGLLTSDSIEMANSGLAEESVEFTIDGEPVVVN